LKHFITSWNDFRQGVEKQPKRWLLCTHEMTQKMTTAFGQLYAKTYFNAAAKQKVRFSLNQRLPYNDVHVPFKQ
jgi:predicted metalloendopeptidase